MRSELVEKIITFLLWIAVALLVICVVLPQGAGFTAIFKTRKVYYVAMILLTVKAGFCLRRRRDSRFLEILPWIALFLFSCFQLARIPSYSFGVDDAYYYSYLGSVWMDHDLDLSNQFESSGLVKYLAPKALEERTSIGLMPNVFPAGLAFFWSPFFGFGYLLAKVAGLPLDGFSRPFVFSVIVGNMFYFCAGLYVCVLFCSKFLRKWLSTLCTLTLLLATPYLYLTFRAFILVSEPLSFSLAALLLLVSAKSENKLSPFLWAAIGLLLGAMTMVRFHNILFGFVPAVILLLNIKRNGFTSKTAILFPAFGVGAILGFLPQLFVWRMMYGQWLVSLGAFLPWWKGPFVLETLFSSRKGLFPWSPIAAISVLGLPLLLKKDRKWALMFIFIFFAAVWINSAQFDWWGATSAGSRRFVPLAVIFVVGLGTLYGRIPLLGKAILVPLLLILIFLNVHLTRSFLRGRLQYEHADRFSDILRGPYSACRYIVYPLEFPVQLAYHIKYGTPMYGPLTEFFIGEDVFYFQERAGDQILSRASPIFGDGWKVNEERKTTGKNAFLYVPMFMKEKPRFFMEFYFEPAGSEKDVWIDFYWNGQFLRSRKVFADGRSIEVAIRSKEYRSSVNELRMYIYHSRGESESLPELILRNIQFRRNQIDSDEP